MNAARAPSGVSASLGRVSGLAKTQYLELTRQPIYGVVLAFGLAIVALSPALAVFSLGRAEALVLDLGASALLFFSVFLAATAVGPSTAERLREGTTAHVLTHPVGTLTYLSGQLLGACVALAQAGLLMTVALLWAVRHGPDSLHQGVLIPALGSIALAIGWGVRANLGQRSFQAAAINAGTLLFPVAYGLSLFLGPDGNPLAQAASTHPTAWAAAALAVLAAVPFAALSLSLAMRFGSVPTAVLTLVFFLASSLVQSVDARASWWLIDLQLFWVGDAGYSGAPVPADYVLHVALYSAFYALACLAAGAYALEGRELGRG